MTDPLLDVGNKEENSTTANPAVVDNEANNNRSSFHFIRKQIFEMQGIKNPDDVVLTAEELKHLKQNLMRYDPEGPLAELPLEMLVYLLGFLDVTDLLPFMRTSKQMYEATLQDELWRGFFARDFPGVRPKEGISAKQSYKNRADFRERFATEYPEVQLIPSPMSDNEIDQIWLQQGLSPHSGGRAFQNELLHCTPATFNSNNAKKFFLLYAQDPEIIFLFICAAAQNQNPPILMNLMKLVIEFNDRDQKDQGNFLLINDVFRLIEDRGFFYILIKLIQGETPLKGIKFVRRCRDTEDEYGTIKQSLLFNLLHAFDDENANENSILRLIKFLLAYDEASFKTKNANDGSILHYLCGRATADDDMTLLHYCFDIATNKYLFALMEKDRNDGIPLYQFCGQFVLAKHTEESFAVWKKLILDTFAVLLQKGKINFIKDTLSSLQGVVGRFRKRGKIAED